MKRLKLGIVLESLGLPLRQAIAHASEIGAEGVQLNGVGDIAPDRLGETGRREFRNLLRSFNLELTAIGCPLRRGLDSPEDLQPRIESIRAVMQLAYDLGARKVVVPCPKVPTDPLAARALHMRDALSALARFGDRSGTLVGLDGGLDSGGTLLEYLNGYDTASLCVNFDPANFLMNGFDPLESLLALRGRIIHSHARDARKASTSGVPVEVAVGAGDIEWVAYLATLESIDYRGYLCVEHETGDNRRADVDASVRFLRRFVGTVSES